MQMPFIKMNGAGNDFVVLDARGKSMMLNFEQVRAIALRDNPITKGCDQVIIIEDSGFGIQDSGSKNPSLNPEPRILNPDCFMRIYNADGGEVDACGNASRCVAHLLAKELVRAEVSIQTNVALLKGTQQAGVMLVDMGEPRLAWDEIPLAIKVDTLKMPMAGMDACCVSMGNPHAVFFMDTLPSDADVARIGSELEHNREIFPEGVNVTFAKMTTPTHITAKVWERGSGMTKACGTGACATWVAAMRLGLTDGARAGIVAYPGGDLSVIWQENNHVLLGGEIVTEFEGVLTV